MRLADASSIAEAREIDASQFMEHLRRSPACLYRRQLLDNGGEVDAPPLSHLKAPGTKLRDPLFVPSQQQRRVLYGAQNLCVTERRPPRLSLRHRPERQL